LVFPAVWSALNGWRSIFMSGTSWCSMPPCQSAVTDVVVMGILVIAAIAFVLVFTFRRIKRVPTAENNSTSMV
jgi:hypothetical protein